MSKVLSILISINVQAKSDINLGNQGMVITNQGGGYPTVFSCKQNVCNFYKTGHWVVFIKTRTETCIKRVELNLPSSKPSGKSCPSGSGLQNWSSFSCSQNCSLTGSPSFTPRSTTHTNKHPINTRSIVELGSEAHKI